MSLELALAPGSLPLKWGEGDCAFLTSSLARAPGDIASLPPDAKYIYLPIVTQIDTPARSRALELEL